jgi:hypothetical protein
MEHIRIAPGNATDRELAIAEVNDVFARLVDLYDLIPQADRNPPPAWMPYLIAEWGLGELSPYLPNLYELARQGVDWQRVRGTPAAVSQGLGWLGYAATYEAQPARRRRWHLWQMALSRLPDAERPDLDRVDGVSSLSDDAISHFWRGFHGYDVRALTGDGSRLDGAICDDHSGVRITGNGAVWSFGRRHEAPMTLGETELSALGTWIPAVGASSAWSTMTSPWAEMTYPWATPAAQARRNVIAAALTSKTWHVAFRNRSGALIGCCRAIVHAVDDAVGGLYPFGAGAVSPSSSPTAVLITARTPFEASPGAVIGAIDLVAGAVLADGVQPGRAWLARADIDVSSGITIPALSDLDVTMAATIREHVLCRMRF